jgi:NADH:ubiquinone oxidoreductase subunit 6 (subunit J)
VSRRRSLAMAAAGAVAIFAVMFTVIRDTAPWNGTPADDSSLGESGPQLDSLVTSMFDTHVLAFEVLGILLTAAMIGALVVARPLSGRHDAENYVQPTDAQVAESMRQSDVRTHFPEGR